ncbi:MAG: hypothetical protein SNJ77_01575 [Cytophagales bacterium]
MIEKFKTFWKSRTAQTESPRLKVYFYLLFSLVVIIFVSNVVFLFQPSTPLIVHVSNFLVWAVLLFFWLYCDNEKKLVISSNIINAVAISVLFLGLFDTGGLFSVDKVWAIVVICAAYFFSGVKSGLIFSGIALLGLLVYFVMHQSYHQDFSQQPMVLDAVYNIITISCAIVVISTLVLAFVVTINRLEKRNKELAEKQINYLNELVLQKITEMNSLRTDLSKDFHDVMGNKLASISSIAQMMEKNKAKGEAILETYISEINSLSKDIYQGTKDFIWTIEGQHHNVLEVFVYLKEFAEKLFLHSDIDFLCDGAEDQLAELPLNQKQASQIILILKEAFTNALVHSKAKTVILSYQLSENYIFLKIQDDGLGFETETLERINGMNNMKERAKYIGAYLEIDSSVGKGTSIVLDINDLIIS